jgi:poly(beta-D-mannuronate) lyase
MMSFKNKRLIFSVIALTGMTLLGCNSIDGKNAKKVMFPADKFDLSSWKMTIPTDSNKDGKVDSVSVRNMQSYQHADYFYLDAQGHMVFATPNKAFTTANSSNTRSELHQVIDGLNTPDKFARNFTLKANKKADKHLQVGGNLQATLKVNHVAKRATYTNKAPAYSVVVGQIHATKDESFVAEGEGYGYGNEPLKIYYKKWPNHQYGSVFWNYERNLEKANPARKDISYPVWGNSWLDSDNPGIQGIALDEPFSYEVNVVENTMYLTFSTARHGTMKFQINLANNIDANGVVDKHDNVNGYAGDSHFFKAGAYNQCSTKDDPGFWYAKCLGTGDWAIDKTNGDYTQVSFMRLVTGPAIQPKGK